MQTATTSQIDTVIDTFIVMGQMFSAYDVTKKLRHNGLHAFHRDVKQVVHQYDYPSHYTSGVHPTLGAIIYHSINDEVDDYDPTAVPEFTATTPAHTTNNGVSSDAWAFVHGAKSTPANTGMFDARNRYCVRAEKVRDAGFRQGITVNVNAENGKLVIDQRGNGSTLTVDCYCNIRIPGSTFSKAFGTLPNKVTVTVNNGIIEIEST